MTRIRISEAGMKEALVRAKGVIEDGGLVAYPTETFYGLGVRYDYASALKRLYEIKRRPFGKPVPLIIGNRRLLSLVAASINAGSEKLMDAFWPRPLTLLFPARQGLSELISAGTGKVAVRMPGESFALDLARSLDFPVTATSANISGMPPADNAEKVIEYFDENLDLLIDGGKTPGGKPSTIVEVRHGEICVIREGAVSSREIVNV